MKGGHDLGGVQGMGKINPEAENLEPVFHTNWERRVFGITLATGMLGKWNIDESRHARERQNPADYLNNSYYENWLVGIEKLLAEKDLLVENESPPKLRVPNVAEAKKILTSGTSSVLKTQQPPAYAVGDSVNIKTSNNKGHTRVPGYAQGATGIVIAHIGCHTFPDKNAHDEHVGEHLYTIGFTGSDLWGAHSENVEVLIDLWEPYLTKASNAIAQE
ncbi:MAG: nitrile hydratase subunit beta [SAR86 cluster bacterium]|uniref:Nitrile hydratase subunit beta n=1 Tax=SAR86 cluster bacterium TaxID=2030880 RepID=A0A2A5BA40_9GAMM|nr:MAG: nitrile hydratase subunit beta [SAR86 cluster bacterium]